MSKDLDKTAQMIPCSECIVISMCNKICDDLKGFVSKYLKSVRDPTMMTECTDNVIERISRDLIVGKIILCDNDWGYRFVR